MCRLVQSLGSSSSTLLRTSLWRIGICSRARELKVAYDNYKAMFGVSELVGSGGGQEFGPLQSRRRVCFSGMPEHEIELVSLVGLLPKGDDLHL